VRVVADARPDLIVLVTTPIEVCSVRLAGRAVARRVGDDPHTATRLKVIYDHCADAWQRVTGTPVLRRPLTTPEDTDEVASELLDELRGAPSR
jgi:dTMP kinase